MWPPAAKGKGNLSLSCVTLHLTVRPHCQVTQSHKCSQRQSAPCVMCSLHGAYSELRNPFHLSLPLHGALDTLITSQGSRLGFEGSLPSTGAAFFCAFPSEREKLLWPQGTCFEGTSLQVKVLHSD